MQTFTQNTINFAVTCLLFGFVWNLANVKKIIWKVGLNVMENGF